MKPKASDLVTALDDLGVFERLERKYFAQWKATTDDDMWPHIRAKVNVLADVRAELRKLANAEGIDNG